MFLYLFSIYQRKSTSSGYHFRHNYLRCPFKVALKGYSIFIKNGLSEERTFQHCFCLEKHLQHFPSEWKLKWVWWVGKTVYRKATKPFWSWHLWKSYEFMTRMLKRLYSFNSAWSMMLNNKSLHFWANERREEKRHAYTKFAETWNNARELVKFIFPMNNFLELRFITMFNLSWRGCLFFSFPPIVIRPHSTVWQMRNQCFM